MWEVVLPNVPVQVGLLTLMNMASLMVLAILFSSLPRILKLSIDVIWPLAVWWWKIGEGVFICSLNLSPKVPKVRTLGERFKEHMKTPSPIFHHQTASGHITSMDNFKILGREENNMARTIKEAMFIRVNNPTWTGTLGSTTSHIYGIEYYSLSLNWSWRNEIQKYPMDSQHLESKWHNHIICQISGSNTLRTKYHHFAQQHQCNIKGTITSVWILKVLHMHNNISAIYIRQITSLPITRF